MNIALPLFSTRKKPVIHRRMMAGIGIGLGVGLVYVVRVVASGIVPEEVIALGNGARTEAGLEILQENHLLTLAAKNKAEDMIKYGYFSHTSPSGIEPWYFIRQAGYQYQSAGENLAMNYTDTKEQHEAWMKSESHRENIMNPRYRETGVGVALGKMDGKMTTVTVQYFASPFLMTAEIALPTSEAGGNQKGAAVQGNNEHVMVTEEKTDSLREEILGATIQTKIEMMLYGVALFFLSLSIIFPPYAVLYQALRQRRSNTA